jgi:hypothetical protein
MKRTPDFHALTKLSLFVVGGALVALGTACGSSSATGGTGGAGGGGAGTGGAGSGDTAKYNFETSTQGWVSGTGAVVFTPVMTSTAQHFTGASSLSGTITAVDLPVDPVALEILLQPTVMIPASTIVTFHVFVPSGAPIDWVQPYAQEDAIMSYRFNKTYTTVSATGAWMSVDVPLPADVTPILKIGVQFHLMAPYTGNVYIDSVNWPG